MGFRESSIVGAYTLVSKLGQGRFGEVWLGRHNELPIDRAIKIPTDPGYVLHLQREARLQFMLDHPHIVKTIDLSAYGEPPHMVLEYVAGTDLRRHICDRGKISIEESAPLVGQILQALEAAHHHRVLHRDLKPENVLLTRDRKAKISDFGLGKHEVTHASDSLLITGDPLFAPGTAEYMSPEQKAGKEASPSDDLYAVGVMGCEMLTGSRPSGVGAGRLCQRAGIGGAIVEVLERALDERRYRYASARDMLDAWSLAAGKSDAPASPPDIKVRTTEPHPERAAVEKPPVARPSGRTVTNSVGMRLVEIPCGEFLMGADASEERSRVKRAEPQYGMRYDCTQHHVLLTSRFFMGAFPVTQRQWKALMWLNPSQFRGDDLPVDSVTWNAATDFCNKLSRREGRRYRLATEAEWEYACRAGTLSAYNIGLDGNPETCAWHSENSGSRTHPPGEKVANAWGLYDMHGNVWEWCQDQYAQYAAGEAVDPLVESAPSGGIRILRGGSCRQALGDCMSSVRFRLETASQSSSVGFRVVLEAEG